MKDNQLDRIEPSNQQKVRLAALWSSWQIGANLVWSCTGVLADTLGATGVEQSLVTGTRTLGNAALQGVWGSLSDRFGRRPFLFLGLLAVGMTAALMPLATTAFELILLLLVPTIVGSAAIPAWSGLLGDITTLKRRGRFIGIITAIGTAASAVALFLVGYYTVSLGLTGASQYYVPLYTSAVITIIALVCVLCIRETIQRTERRIFNFRSASRGTPRFRSFLLINAIFFCAMGAAWPLFPKITNLYANVFQVLLLTALFSLFSGATQILGGTLIDRFGRKGVLFTSRFLIFLAPLSHAMAAMTDNVWFLVPSQVFGGGLTGLFIVSSTAWLLDSSPAEDRASVTALFNFVTGVTSFAGAMIAGFILDWLMLLWDKKTVLIVMMLTIVVIRIITSTGYIAVSETLPRKSKVPWYLKAFSVKTAHAGP
jgi:MFS family permease